MAVDTSGGTIFVGSKEKAKDGYGQNGWQGASSVTPGQSQPHMNGVADHAMEAVIADGVRADNYQTRTIDAAPYPTHPGHHNPNADPVKIPSATYRGTVARHPEMPISKQGHARRR